MMKKIFALAALLMFAAAPLAIAHDPPSPNTSCDPTQDEHDYGLPGSVVYGTQSTGTTNVNPPPYVMDGNLENCPPDNDPTTDTADFDGDLEYGVGSGFFPAGKWAADSTCDYGLTAHHGPNFHVHASLPDETTGVFAAFTVGSDPTPPTPVPSTDLDDDDGWDCVTDGAFTPDITGGNCLQSFVHTGTTTCLPGGDGGWWVWINCEAVITGDHIVLSIIPLDVQINSLPSGANVACSLAGHITAA